MNKTISDVVNPDGTLLSRVAIQGQFGSIDAIVPFVRTPGQESATVGITKLDVPKLPWDSDYGGVVQAYNYFSAVWDKQRSEAFVWWHWDAAEERYYMVVPAFGHASTAGVQYKHSSLFCKRCRVGLAEGIQHCPHCGEAEDVHPLVIFGTSHSHGEMAPFHSGTDDQNELTVTGFHITFGHLSKGPAGLANSFVVSDSQHRFSTTWLDHFAFELADLSMWRLHLWLSLIAPSSTALAMKPCLVNDSKDRVVFGGTADECASWVAASEKYMPGEFRVVTKPVVPYQASRPAGFFRNHPDYLVDDQDWDWGGWSDTSRCLGTPHKTDSEKRKHAKKRRSKHRETLAPRESADTVTYTAALDIGLVDLLKKQPLSHVPITTFVVLDCILDRQLERAKIDSIFDLIWGHTPDESDAAYMELHGFMLSDRTRSVIEAEVARTEPLTLDAIILDRDAKNLCNSVLHLAAGFLKARNFWDKTGHDDFISFGSEFVDQVMELLAPATKDTL